MGWLERKESESNGVEWKGFAIFTFRIFERWFVDGVFERR
jgi:hypothetical protein